eukprot:Anaeramoba_flamelloidesa1057193_67.p2 GENE.a1057193_67~~a1057193_67.p2  ORF type:complete len:210 (-),score=13.28 a1057193_67:279-908(-)
MLAKWKAMSKKDRLLYKLLFIFLIFIVYSVTVFPFTKKRYDRADQMLSRIENRLEVHGKLPEIPDLPPLKTLEKKLAQMDEDIKKYSIAAEDLDTGFVPLNSDQMRQQLLLEISNLAERSRIDLTSLSRKKIYANTKDPGVDPEFGRPILLLEGKGGFWDLHKFLTGLEDLSFFTAVVRFRVFAFSGDLRDFAKVKLDGVLNIYLEMTI